MTVDMSAQAVTLRLKRASQLRSLCLSLGRARKAAPENDTRPPWPPLRDSPKSPPA